jgi:hypothetical protein
MLIYGRQREKREKSISRIARMERQKKEMLIELVKLRFLTHFSFSLVLRLGNYFSIASSLFISQL